MIPRRRFDRNPYRERAATRPGDVGVRMGRLGAVGLKTAYSLGVNTTGVNVTEDSSLTLPAVFAAVSVISKDLSTLPLTLKKRREDGFLEDAKDHPAYKLFLRSPDGGNTTPSSWRMALMLHALVWGNAYAEIVRNGFGEVVSLELRDPVEILPYYNGSEVWYKHSGPDLPREKIVHVRALSKEGIYGYSPVMLARQAIGLGLTGERFAGQYMSSGLQSSGVIYTPANMDGPARKELAASIKEMVSGESAFGLIVLPPDCKFEATSTDPDKAQLLESRKHQVLEVCRLWGVPPHKVMSFEHAAYSTIEASNLEYATGTLGPWAVIIEQAFDLRLLTEQEQVDGYCFKHDFSQLLRGDSASMINWFKGLNGMGAMNSNQIAIAAGLPPHDGGDKYLMPLNMVDDASKTASVPKPTEEPNGVS